MDKLIKQVCELIEAGIYDPEELYTIVQRQNRYHHYSTVRRAVHLAKTRL